MPWQLGACVHKVLATSRLEEALHSILLKIKSVDPPPRGHDATRMQTAAARV